MKLRINGQTQELDLDPRTTLLDALREHLHLTGTRKGCDHGQCGSCTVLVEGRRINACLTLAVMHEGDDITTVEGLADDDGELHPLQRAFVERDAFQCGYCTSGQLCSAVALLGEVERGEPSLVTPPGEEPRLSPEEVRERMSGNLCRCGAYANIVESITTAGQS